MSRIIIYPSYLLNETGAKIWKMCDGKHTIKEILSALCQEFAIEEAEEERVLADVISYLKQLEKLGLIFIRENL